MAPFHSFRLWLRRGPTTERIPAAIAAVLTLVLVAWFAVPVDDEDVEAGFADSGFTASTNLAESVPASESASEQAEGEASFDTGSGAPSLTQGGASVPAPTAGGEGPTQTTVASTGEGSTDPCAQVTSSGAPGISDSTIRVALTVVDLAGPVGQETFGVPGNLDQSAGAIVAGLNAEGGAACREIEFELFKVNPIDQNDQRATCGEIASADLFAVIDYAGFVSGASQACFPDRKVPYIGLTSMTQELMTSRFPYMASVAASTDQQLRNLAFGLKERGLLQDPALKKLGVFISSCNPQLNSQLRADLNSYGIANNRISWFEGTCELINPPSQVSQAVTQHRRDGVTHTLLATSISSSQGYVRTANDLAYEPRYFVSDYGSNTQGASGWPEAFDGGSAITSTRNGELNAGIANDSTERCQGWFVAAGMKRQGEGGGGLVMCDLLRAFDAAADAAGPSLTRESLIPSLAEVGTFRSSALGDAVYREGKYWGGDFIRRIEYSADCTCWMAVEPTTTQAPS